MSSQREILLKQLQRRGDANQGYDNFIKSETMTREAILEQLQKQKKKDDIILEQDFVPIDDRRKERRIGNRALLSLSEMVEGLNESEDGPDIDRVTSNAKRLKGLVLSNELDIQTLKKINKAMEQVERIAEESDFSEAELSSIKKLTRDIINLSKVRQVPASEIQKLLSTIDPTKIDTLYEEYRDAPTDEAKDSTTYAILLEYIKDATGKDLEGLRPQNQKKIIRQFIQREDNDSDRFLTRLEQNEGEREARMTQITEDVKQAFRDLTVGEAEDLLDSEGVEKPAKDRSWTDEDYKSELQHKLTVHLQKQLPSRFDIPNTRAVDEAKNLKGQRDVLDQVRREMEEQIEADIREREQQNALREFRNEVEEELRKFTLKRNSRRGPKKAPYSSVIRVLEEALDTGNKITTPGNASRSSKETIGKLNQLRQVQDRHKEDLTQDDIDEYEFMAQERYNQLITGKRELRPLDIIEFTKDMDAPAPAPAAAAASASASSAAPAPAPAPAKASASASAKAPEIKTYKHSQIKKAKAKALSDGVDSFMWNGKTYVKDGDNYKLKGGRLPRTKAKKIKAGQYNTTEHKKKLIREFLN